MIGTVLGQVTGQLEKRFILNAFFPTLVFVLASALAVAAAVDGPLPAIESWEGDSSGAKALIAIAGIGGVFLLANLLSNAMQEVIRLFEGYLLRPKFVRRMARRRQVKRAMQLLQEAASEDHGKSERAKSAFQLVFPVYPTELTEDVVAATRLGNILRSAETYSRSRYGADAVRIWSRLYPLLPEPISASMVSARTSMEFLLAVSFLSGLYAPLASIYLILQNGPLIWIVVALCAGTAISIAAYHASLQPAAVYGEQIRAAIDLHRLELIKAMGKPLPATLEEERRTWRELHMLFNRGAQDANWRYVVPASE